MGIQTARRPFLRQDRLRGGQPLRLEDVAIDDVAHDYTSDMQAGSGNFQPPQQGMPYVTSDEQQPEVEVPQIESVGFNAAKMEQPSNRRRALAESLIQQGSQPFKTGAGWWGVADRVAATGVGSWMEDRENTREAEAKQKSLNEFLSSLDDNDPVHRYAKTLAASDLGRATDLILRHETQKEIAKMKAANTPAGYKQRSYDKGDTQITEYSNDGGATWKGLATAPRSTSRPGGLTPENAYYYADAYVRTGDKSIFMRMPFADVSAVRNLIPQVAKERGMSPEQISARVAEFSAFASGLRTSMNQQAKIDSIAAEAKLFAKLSLDRSAKIPRGQFVPGNKLLQDVKLMMSNPAYHGFVVQNTSLAHAMAAVAGRGQTNQHLQELFEKKLNTAASHEAYAEMVNVIIQDAEAIMKAPAMTREHMIEGFVTRLGGNKEQATKAIRRDKEISEVESMMLKEDGTGQTTTTPTPAKEKQIKDPDNPGKMITIVQQPDGSWVEK